MQILLDVDGVVADFLNHLLEKMYECYGGILPNYNDFEQFELSKTFSLKQYELAKHILSNKTFWDTIPRIKGSLQAVNRLREIGDIIWVTSPWSEICPAWYESRYRWLMQHCFATSTKDIIFCHRKELINGDVFIDDREDNVKMWAGNHPGKLAFLYTAPYNKRSFSFDRITWDNIEDLIKRIDV